jgi:subtilisin family serine protease
MKSLKKIIVLFVLSIFSLSCSEDHLYTEEKSQKSLLKENSLRNNNNNISNLPVYSRNKLIIQYLLGTPNSVKSNLRDIFGVQNYEICEHCEDKNIELWIFDKGILIEPKKTTIETGSGGGIEYIVEVDYEFVFGIDLSNPYLGTDSDTSFYPYIKSDNEGVTVAVLDTGIAPTIGADTSPIFASPFLYNASNDGYTGVESGWDFVNDDSNCFDDNGGRHGTVVSSIIHNVLNNDEIPHQILPIKIANRRGQISYFGLLCGFNFALNHAQVVQMSFGWYDDGSGDQLNTIFSELLNLYPNVMVVTSAGNDGFNNDVVSHYPSNYPQDNLIAVAAANKKVLFPSSIGLPDPNIAGFSNYGIVNVDFFAPGEGIPFLGYDMDGTSFAAPFVSGVVARIVQSNPGFTPNNVLDALTSYGEPCPVTFSTTRKVKHNRIIMP